MNEILRRGLMLVISSPSGAGKSTLAHHLLQSDENIVLSVSATTRTKRPGEVEGSDYFFVTPQRFEEMVAQDEFLEHATVFGNQYGTPRKSVEDVLESGRDVLFDIDWQGTQQLEQKAKDDLVRVFILPPSREELERRLRARAEDSADVVVKRMAKANDEISHWAEYDYIILNDDIAQARTQLESILSAERLKRRRQTGLVEFVNRLSGD
ncbi:MAG: guanylate kinase [Micropepsaceae bacterium]